jgi:hypothetical protein
MPLYMTQFAYTPEAWAALVDNPEDRSAPVRELTEAMGGRVIGWHLSFGEYDGLVIYETRDNATAGGAGRGQPWAPPGGQDHPAVRRRGEHGADAQSGRGVFQGTGAVALSRVSVHSPRTGGAPLRSYLLLNFGELRNGEVRRIPF